MKFLVLFGTFVSLGMLAIAGIEVRRIFVADERRNLIRRYTVEAGVTYEEPVKPPFDLRQALAGIANTSRARDWIVNLLEAADIRVSPERAVIGALGADVVLTMLLGTWTGSLFLGQFWTLLFLAGGFWQYVRFHQNRRRMAFEKGLPDFLMLLSSSLRAGLSLQRGIEAVSSEGDGEVERQLRRASTEIAMGVQPDVALGEVAERMRSTDMQWVVVAIGVQRKVGGNLAFVLDLVVDTIRARESIRQEVRAVSSEGRMSANVLVALPIGGFILLVATRLEYVQVLWLTPTGRALLFTTVLLIASGLIWVRSMVEME